MAVVTQLDGLLAQIVDLVYEFNVKHNYLKAIS
jgi:hypothetical protein